MEDEGVFWTVTVLNPDGTPPPVSRLPAPPRGWPATLQLGLTSPPGGATALRASTSLTMRYQYLAGGVNTGSGWTTWNDNATFVSRYITESQAAGFIPFFSYYQLLQSAPGNKLSEPDSDFANLANVTTMRDFFNDLKLALQRASGSGLVILQVEPDLWGYIEQRGQDDPSRVAAQVSATGLSELAGLPNDGRGVAQAAIRLRDLYAPNVLLAYPVSVWGTMHSVLIEKPADATVARYGDQAGAFYLKLGAKFDLATAEFNDRDAGFKQYVSGQPDQWWAPADHDRDIIFFDRFVQSSGLRVVKWQIALGNNVMRAMNNTWGHYQDTIVQSLLASDALRARYVQAGVIGFLFGGGAAGTTCACDAMADGVTNPAPINGNDRMSLSADDDGGFFKEQVQRVYAGRLDGLP
jgi:hypothetical protein